MDMNTAGGLAAIMIGIILLTTQYWAGPSHTYQGVNWVNLLQFELNVSGILITGAGIAILLRVFLDIIYRDYVFSELNLPKDN